MKKLFLLLACACLMFGACEEFMQLQEEEKVEQEEGKEDDADNEKEDEKDKEDEDDKTGNGSGGSDSSDGSGNGSGGSGNSGGNGDTLTPDAQKIKLEAVGNRLLALYPAEDYAELSDLWKHWEASYLIDGYWDDVITEYETEEDIVIEELIDAEQSVRQEILTFVLASYKGEIVLGESKAVLTRDETASELRLRFVDMEGKPCTAVLTCSGKTTEAFLGKYVDEWRDWDDKDKDGDTSEIIREEYSATITVPEEIRIDVTLGSGQYATVLIKTSLSIGYGGITFASTDLISEDITIRISDTEVNIKKAGYSAATGNGQFSYKMTKGGRTLVSADGQANGRFKLFTDTFDYDGTPCEYTSIEVLSLSSIVFSVDILNEIQIKGECTDGYALFELYDEDLDNETNQSAAWAEVVDDMNECFGIRMYYDNTSTVQADLMLEPDVILDEWSEYTYFYYDVMPVICFKDGSKYSFEEYFTEDAFSTLTGAAADFVESYGDMFGIEKEQVDVVQPGY